jgi:LCP family protein required for cell wall assembly
MRTGRVAPFAAALSFVLPGLGQLVLGRRRRALVLAAPFLAVGASLAALAVAVATDPSTALDLVPGPEAIAALVALDLALLAWHGAAIVDAERLARLARPVHGWVRAAAGGVLATLLVAALALHGAIGYVGMEARDAVAAVFRPEDPGAGWSIPDTSFAPDASPVPTSPPPPSPPVTPRASALITPAPTPGQTPEPTPTPSPTPKPVSVPAWAEDGRLDLLLIGSDAGPDRWSLRTDTIMVLSVQVKTGRAALFGIPRNLVGVPLPPESAGAFPDGRFPGLLNALYVYAMARPERFPGGDARGMRAVSGAVQELVGVRLDGMVVVNLGGFVRLVDELGGLWIDVPAPLFDKNYPLEDGSGHIVLDIRAGCQHLDGRMALAYARSRHQDSDYGRMRRQQTVLLSIRSQLDPLKVASKAPRLLRIAGESLWTTVRRSQVRGLARLADQVDVRRVARVLFVPPRYPSHLESADIRRIRRVVRTIFDGRPPPADPELAPGHCP